MSAPAANNPVQAGPDLRWGGGASIADRLYLRSSTFNFYQAVRILSILCGDPADKISVRFRSRMGFAFPSSDIDRIEMEENATAPTMVVNFLALAGAHGPLPAAYTPQLAREKKGAQQDFFDIFHNRLVLLAYRIHAMHHPELTGVEPSQGIAANFLFALFGLGRDATSPTRNRFHVPDRALLEFSGLLAHRPRSSAGLQCLLRNYFGVDTRIHEFTGTWLDLSEDQWTRIGKRHGRNQVLGDNAVIGKRVWDEHAAITIELGPMDLETYTSFLPDGDAYRPVCDLVRLYLGDEFDFTFRLILRQDETPAASSGPSKQPDVRPAVLGRLAWLRSPGQNGTGHANGTNGTGHTAVTSEKGGR